MPTDRKALPLRILIHSTQGYGKTTLTPLVTELLQRGYTVVVHSSTECEWNHQSEALCVLYDSVGQSLALKDSPITCIDMHQKSTDDILSEIKSGHQEVEKTLEAMVSSY